MDDVIDNFFFYDYVTLKNILEQKAFKVDNKYFGLIGNLLSNLKKFINYFDNMRILIL